MKSSVSQTAPLGTLRFHGLHQGVRQGLVVQRKGAEKREAQRSRLQAFHLHSGTFVFICVLYVVVLHTASLTEGSAAF